MRILFWALLLAVAWVTALSIIAGSPGLHTPAGMWVGVFGFPGVVVASWVRPFLGRNSHDHAGYVVMFLVNWMFYCSVLQGLLSVKSALRAPQHDSREPEKPGV